jgi:hypothetical protein
MIINEREYVKPTKGARMLCLLEALAADGSASQHELGLRSCLSGAMVNQYLRELQERSYLRFVPANGKSFRYLVTPRGEKARSEMFASYSSELVRLYSALKAFIAGKLSPLRARGVRRLALYGASETCEVVLAAIRDMDFRIVALVDNDPSKHGTVLHGQTVSSPRVLEDVSCQAIVVTSFGCREEICAQIATLANLKGMEIIGL